MYFLFRFTSRYPTRYQFHWVICSQFQLLCLPLRVNSTGFGRTVWDHKDPLVPNLRISELEGNIWWGLACKPRVRFPLWAPPFTRRNRDHPQHPPAGPGPRLCAAESMHVIESDWSLNPATPMTLGKSNQSRTHLPYLQTGIALWE